jgi:hypothetical protein
MLSWMFSVVRLAFTSATFPFGKEEVIQAEHINKSTRITFSILVGFSIGSVRFSKVSDAKLSEFVTLTQFQACRLKLVA